MINVYENNELVLNYKHSLENKRVYIPVESRAVGDTIAWFSAVEEFRKKHKCQVIVSTFHNEWFISEYPNIIFVNPETNVNDLYAIYRIGWFYTKENKIDYDRSLIDFRAKPLQQTATSILGITPKEIKPKITVPNRESDIDGKYVVIAPHASNQSKYWNYPGGWQIIINHLNDIGYKVVLITQEILGDEKEDIKIGGKLLNVIDKSGNISMFDRMVDIRDSSLFIGMGSGLSWVSWVVGAKTILISGVSEKYSEFEDCIRISTEKPYACSGCLNKHKIGDFSWCPEHHNTNRMYECSKTIEPAQIITEINKILL